MTTYTLKPGVLVSLKTSIDGGIHYQRIDIEDSRDNVTTTHKWETTRIIDDADEWDRACKARNEARRMIARECVPTSFGLLCPTDNEDKLVRSIGRAREITEAHNAKAERTRVDVYCIRGTIAQSDDEAARAIAADVSGLLDTMERGVAGSDVQSIRKAAMEAKRIGAMLDESKAAKVSEAVAAARTAATAIVKRVQKNGEDCLAEIQRDATQPINMARIAFLDIDDADKTDDDSTNKNPAMPAIDVQRIGGVEV